MKRLAPLLTWLVILSQTRIQNGLNEDLEKEFKRAVVQAYNASESFSSNFYELLGLICPESVYCQTNGTFDKGNADFGDLVTEDISDTDGFLQNYNQTAISEARIFLEMNFHHMRGCCVHCSCNSDCRERSNCCPAMDARITDPETLQPTSHATQECVYANALYYVDGAVNQQYSFDETIGNSFFMESDCSLTSTVGDGIATKCRQPDTGQLDESLPVYSTDLKRIFQNIFCARCNAASPVTAMAPMITLNNFISLTETVRLPGSPDELFRMILSMPRFFDMRYIFPKNDLDIQNFGCTHYPTSLLIGSAKCESIADLDNDQRYLFKRACEMERHLYHTNKVPYRNVFCFLCHSFYGKRKTVCGLHAQPHRYFEDSFSVLFRGRQPDASVQPEATTQANEPCSCAEVFDRSKKRCREIICPPGEMRILCACVPFITNITDMRIRLHLEITPQLPDNVQQKQTLDARLLQSDGPAAITKAVKRAIASRFGPLTSENQFLFRERATTTGTRTGTFHYCELVTLRGISDNREELEHMFTTLHAGFTKKILGTQMRIFLGRIFDLDSRSTVNITVTELEVGTKIVLERLYPALEAFEYFQWGRLSKSQPLKKLVYSKRVMLDEEEIEIVVNVTRALGWSQAYLECVYREEDGVMCLEDFEAAFMPDTSGTGALRFWLITKRELLLVISALVIYLY